LNLIEDYMNQHKNEMMMSIKKFQAKYEQATLRGWRQEDEEDFTSKLQELDEEGLYRIDNLKEKNEMILEMEKKINNLENFLEEKEKEILRITNEEMDEDY